jgi:hypothetical protein
MNYLKKLLLVFCLLLSSLILKADSWIDPDWKEMIMKSHTIVLGEITKEGAFRAKVKIVKTLAGNMPQTDFWVSGHSNRYGPFDTLRVGEQYYFFLKKPNFSEKNKKSISENLGKTASEKEYVEAYQNENVFNVWTPTAGEVFAQKGSVYYDLLFNGDSKRYAPKPKAEFEEFIINARSSIRPPQYFDKLVKSLRDAIQNPTEQRFASQYLMMLFVLDCEKYYPVFEVALQDTVAETRYALAKVLGGVKDEKAFDLLSKLLDDKLSVVQGEAVRNLKTMPPEKVAPLLLSKLSTTGTEGIYPSNIMDPVRNEFEGGKIEIIKTLGDLKYKPAGKALLPLLETTDDYLFRTVMTALTSIGEQGFVPYFNAHLDKGTKSLTYEICKYIEDLKLKECKEPLKNYIRTHNKNEGQDQAFTISTCYGLAGFDDSDTRDFIRSEFEKMLSPSDTTKEDNKDDWVKEFMDVFAEWKDKDARPLVQEAMHQYFGYNSTYAAYPQLFKIKKALEDSLERLTPLKPISDSFKITMTAKVDLKNHKELAVNPNLKPVFNFYVKANLKIDKKIEKELAQRGIGEVPYFEWFENVRQLLSKTLNCPYEITAATYGSYVSGCYKQFDDSNTDQIFDKFWEYCTVVPQKEDLLLAEYLMNKAEKNREKADYDLKKAYEELKKKFK